MRESAIGGSRDQRDVGPDDNLRLALEIRSRRFGFVLLQGASRLLDWGVREYPKDMEGGKDSAMKIAGVVTQYRPGVVIMRRTRRVLHPSSKDAAATLRHVTAELARRGTNLMILDRPEIRHCFSRLGCRGKYEVGCWLAKHFPELERYLPNRRKPWDREEYIVPAFDALATAVAFSGKPDNIS